MQYEENKARKITPPSWPGLTGKNQLVIPNEKAPVETGACWR
jgi:hypothetical protein